MKLYYVITKGGVRSYTRKSINYINDNKKDNELASVYIKRSKAHCCQLDIKLRDKILYMRELIQSDNFPNLCNKKLKGKSCVVKGNLKNVCSVSLMRRHDIVVQELYDFYTSGKYLSNYRSLVNDAHTLFNWLIILTEQEW